MIASQDDPSHGVSFRAALGVWVRVAALSFGGPAGQIAVMHRIIVEEKRWISERRFMHALNYCMLLPGPEAQQLATYIGWLMHRTKGGLVAGGLFILPGVIALMGLSVIYALYGAVGIVAAMFFGLKAAVLAVVVEALIRIGKRSLKTTQLRLIAALAFVGIFVFALPFPLVILTAGCVGLAGVARVAPPGEGQDAADTASLLGETQPPHTLPSARRALRVAALWLTVWLAPVALILLIGGPHTVYAQIALFFSKMAVVTFGGAYAVLAYVAQQAVGHYHWLSPSDMLNGLGMAETTPGPLIMVLQFVGFMAAFRVPGQLPPLLAGAMGGLIASWVTFAPCFLWIFVGGPYIEQLRSNRRLAGALAGISAAVVGAVLNLALWFAIHTLFRRTVPLTAYGAHFDAPVLASVNAWAMALALLSALAIFHLRLGMLPTLAAAGAAGIGLRAVGLV